MPILDSEAFVVKNNSFLNKISATTADFLKIKDVTITNTIHRIAETSV